MTEIKEGSGVDDAELLDARTVAKLTRKDVALSRVHRWILQGWPSGPQGDEFSQFVRHRHELSAVRGCLLWRLRVMILK
ncbi:hypothetical protein M513_10535 [Trichuris suis]|uniref:Uncharacterized protein n=1 Tax=Trichuris suis TaxID=68888 RepID=A0A085LUF5_9BILA|nr:hypothetical protein M513_10535 [Trichuris suis]